MFDDSIIKVNDNPAEIYPSLTYKLKWVSEKCSTVSSLGEAGEGLFAFNKTVKDSIKYMYLNNNSFSNVNALRDFSHIVELQLQCNPNLSNIDGLSEHTGLDVLTIHNCSLSSIGNYNEDTKVYSGGLTGCSALSKLSLQNNKSLGSLIGIESSINLACLIANDCNITDISSLKNHSKVSYLNLANNVNLINVKYIQYCKALKYIYLDNNAKMDNAELDIALNGTSDDYGRDVLIKNCQNGYQNIPKNYWGLFQSTSTVLDYSYATLGSYLSVDSTEWLKLKDRTDVEKLKLDGQTKLPMNDDESSGVKKYGINTVLSSLTGMKALSLCNCSQLSSLDFAKNMKELCEIDLRGISKNLKDYSSLNFCENLFKLLIDNPEIDLKKIVTTLNNIAGNQWKIENSWFKNSYPGIGLYNAGPWVFYDESNENKLLKFSYCLNSPAYTGTISVDLSHTSCTSVVGYANDYYTASIILPKKVTYISADCSKNSSLDFSNVEAGTEITEFRYGHNTDTFLKKTLSTTSNVVIEKLTLWCDAELSSDDLNFNSVKELSLSKNSTEKKILNWNLKCFENNNFTEKIRISDSTNRFENKILNLDSFGKNRCIKEITFTGLGLDSLNWIKDMTQVLILNLSNNRISNIESLSKLEKLQSLVLNKNSITDLTPLVTAIGDDGVINYTSLDISNNSLDGYTFANNIEALLKLHEAGLQKVTITGNDFTVNDVNQLINGSNIDGVDYQGFGKENVIN